MSVVAETPISSSVANGVTTVFPYSFTVLTAADLKVQGELLGAKTVYTLGVDYTLSGVGTGAGSVTFLAAPASGTVITRYRDTEIKRATDYQDNGDLLASVVNSDFDRLWLVLQEIYSGGKGAPTSLRVPNGETVPALAAAASRANRVLAFDSSGDPITIPGVDSGSAAALAIDLADGASTAKGDALIAVKQPYTGSVARTQHDRNADELNVKDFGAVGTANIANQAADTAAFLAALATGRNVYVPEGTYYLSQTISIGYGQRLYGAGQYKTILICSGSGSAIYMGSDVLTSLIYNCELLDLTIACTNRASTVNGVELQNCVYFLLRNLSIFGSGSPNSPNAPDRVLYGSGVYLHDNTIIGELDHVSCRLWNVGRRYATDAGNQSRWTAAIIDHGHGELANVMRGITVGDASVGLYSGVGLTLRDLTFQGCYTTGINVNAGDGTIIEACYFEGNGNYDIAVGTPSGAPTPIGIKLVKNLMNAEDIGTTPYGTFPYIAKIYVDRGVFTTIRDNNLSISTAIPLVSLTALSETANISGNRLNSAIAVDARILDNGASTITADNYPEKPRFATGAITRALDAATGNVSYTGLGFRPTNIEFVAAVSGTVEICSGSAGVGVGLQNRCITTDAAGANTSSADAIRIIRSSAGNEQKATVISFDADGFTLAWTKVGAPPSNTLTVNYIARR